ncbi:hypothetical protein EVAR_76476_1 [Eumeta japonica]|uniref:Uncharacterized protein n=1 Tax=Eumeta variegata TaxID=151549 RepID=A0A4C1T4K6_EUMVA|nr:hypothetical protein EVAR_76476_1 [Eumeta japonica]
MRTRVLDFDAIRFYHSVEGVSSSHLLLYQVQSRALSHPRRSRADRGPLTTIVNPNGNVNDFADAVTTFETDSRTCFRKRATTDSIRLMFPTHRSAARHRIRHLSPRRLSADRSTAAARLH